MESDNHASEFYKSNVIIVLSGMSSSKQPVSDPTLGFLNWPVFALESFVVRSMFVKIG